MVVEVPCLKLTPNMLSIHCNWVSFCLSLLVFAHLNFHQKDSFSQMNLLLLFTVLQAKVSVHFVLPTSQLGLHFNFNTLFFTKINIPSRTNYSQVGLKLSLSVVWGEKRTLFTSERKRLSKFLLKLALSSVCSSNKLPGPPTPEPTVSKTNMLSTIRWH